MTALLANCASSRQFDPSLPRNKTLTGVPFVKQGKNECGAASMAMVLGYYGIEKPVEELRQALKWSKWRGIGLRRMKAYPASLGLQAKTFSGWKSGIPGIVGHINQGRPVIVRQWSSRRQKQKAWVGHYQVVVGYDLDQQELYLHDPLRKKAGFLVLDFKKFEFLWDMLAHPVPSYNWMLVVY